MTDHQTDCDIRLLAQSEHYKISHEFETVYLELNSGERVIIDDFYGDPSGALIDRAERWCFVYGEHVLFYRLTPPFLDCSFTNGSEQCEVMFKGWYIENAYQISGDIVRFVADPWGDRAGLYELEISELVIVKVTQLLRPFDD